MDRKPNIIYIYGDDLGRGMLSCYGQKHFNTPNIDALAENGVTFNRAYGCAFCAPSRASLLSGIHDCHAGRWTFTSGGIYEKMGVSMSYEEISELINNTGFNDIPNTEFLPHVVKKGGYFTGQIGKLEWGFATSDADIRKHGWDYHYGYYDHQQCHGFYPPFMFEDGKVVDIDGNTHMNCGVTPHSNSEENRKLRHDMTGKNQYSQDLFNDKIVEFISKHKNEPFFLYHPSQLPHGPIAVPEIHEGVTNCTELSEFEKEYASMVLRLDDTVGIIINTLKKYDLLENTLLMFSADNGHELYYAEDGRGSSKNCVLTGKPFDDIDTHFTTETANDIFNGNSGLKGRKRSNSEGGVRVPLIACQFGKTPKGAISEKLVSNYDLMPTLAELVGSEMPLGKDGTSYYKELNGDESCEHDYIVYASHRGPGLTMRDGWKIRYLAEVKRFELYKVDEDYAEKNNLADKYPEKLRELAQLLLKECDGNFDNGAPFIHRVVTVDKALNGIGPWGK